MLIVLIIITAVIVLTVLSVFVSRLINSDKNKIDTKTGIQESTYIDIDGMKQYVQIRGKNTTDSWKKYQKSRYDFYTRGSCKSYGICIRLLSEGT